MSQRFKWAFEVKLDIAEMWVADGFNPTADQMEEIIRNAILQYAYSEEKNVSVKILKRANQRAVAKAQGFASVKLMQRAEGRE